MLLLVPEELKVCEALVAAFAIPQRFTPLDYVRVLADMFANQQRASRAGSWVYLYA